MEETQKPIPMPAVIALVVVALAAIVFVVMQVSRPSAGGTAEAAAIAKEIKAPPTAPVVPREAVQADVMMRGAGKNTGR